MSPDAPRVDVVVAVHSPERPIERAVASALANRAPLRVTVVAHNTDPAAIATRLGARADDPRVRMLALDDGIPSPAGPFNLGLAEATAEFTSVLGSDDAFEPRAVDAWLAVADRDRASAVVARLRHVGGRAAPTPPTRPFRRRLDPVRDRLAYRSAPLGLVSRAAFGELRFAEHLPSGEDIPYVAAVWYSGERISYDRRGPGYLVHADAAERVTHAPMGIAAEFGYLPHVLGSEVLARSEASARSALAIKLLRVNLFGAVRNRPEPARWTDAERRALADAAATIISAGGGIERVLSRRERDLLDAALDPARPTEALLAADRRRRARLAPGSLVPRSLGSLAHREAPIRFSAASALALLR
ncbi:glycosyltransferase family A protein [Agromyces intestinalis]|uniref:glycosyltransferase family A protein n=1 Tax=Agromyces intestinalis TaxID=2592652 RepID=UPI00143DB42E|nr:glycosyltransferase family A protein [Agromyces intestinalis]